jgi:acetylornithine deacetylase/succinyl-diaminopimelate desuccinylase
MRIESAVSKDELCALASDLVRIPSYPGIPAQESEVACFIESVFRREGIDCELSELEDGRLNVVARLKGTGGGKNLLLCGHTDTVKPDGMLRANDPYIKDDLLYGRGTADMKGPIASMISAMIGIKRAGLSLKGDVIFAGVADEEQRSLGTINLVESGLKADGAIVGEPTGFKLCTAHRGLEWFEFNFIGKTVHGGDQENGVNAIEKAVKFIQAIDDELAPALAQIKHPLLEHATVNCGYIHGGTQPSTVAGECILQVDRRFLPQERYIDVQRGFEELIEKLEADDSEFRCEMKVMDESLMPKGFYHPPLETNQNDPLCETCFAVLNECFGENAEKGFFPAWTDGALISKYLEIPTVILGPGYIESAHSKIESIPLAHLKEAYLIYARIAEQFTQSP